MIKGIVTAVKNNKAIILKNDGTFVRMQNKNYSVGQKITFSEKAYIKYAAIAASFIFLFSGVFSGYKLAYTPFSYIYIDINPSIRLDVNVFNKVISVNPLNSDASELIEEFKVTDKHIDVCIDNIIAACEQAEYINESNTDVEIDIMSEHMSVSEYVNSISSKYADTLQMSVRNVSEEESRQADDMGVSVSQLNAIKQYTEVFGGELTDNVRNLKNVSKKKIHRDIEDKKIKDSYIPEEETYKNNGSEHKPQEKSSPRQNVSEYDKTINDTQTSDKSEPAKPNKQTDKETGKIEKTEQKENAKNEKTENKNKKDKQSSKPEKVKNK